MRGVAHPREFHVGTGVIDTMYRFALASCCLVVCFSSWCAAGEVTPAADQGALEKQFTEHMTGAVLVGKFTVLDLPVDPGPKPDKYTITKVEKKEGNNWLFVARVEYSNGSYPVALKIPVEWAGKTAVISVSDMEIPLVAKGVFNARVLIDGDRYAGTWSHDKLGGHMFGRIEKPAPPPASPTPSK